LIAGAERHVKNNKGETALDIAQDKEFEGIVRMLNDNYSLVDKLKIICNAKTKYEPVQRSNRYPLLFCLLSLLFAGFVFGVVQLNSLLLFVLQTSILGACVLLFGSLVLLSPKLSTHQHNYNEFAETTRLFQVCMVCVREMKPREHHCHICRRCVAQYDHHCSWINNCVGKHNIARFNLMLIILEVSILWISYVAVTTVLTISSRVECS
jgi:hypothetical protein